MHHLPNPNRHSIMSGYGKKWVFFTGAGCSAASGLPTFRGEGGIWDEIDAEAVASKKAWYCGRCSDCNERRQRVLDFFNPIRRKIIELKPNDAHTIIGNFEWLSPSVTVITQNGDDFHERSFSKHVIHLHGELAKVCSSIDKEKADCIETKPLDEDIHIGDKAKDGSQLRPYIVWFGEAVPNMKDAMNTAFEADIFVVIGTSLLVSPANTLTACSGASHNIVIDPGEVEIPEGFLHIKETATVGMEMLYQSLIKLPYV